LTKKVVILGGEGVGVIAATIVEKYPDLIVEGFLNDVVPVGSMIGKFKKFPVIGKSEDVSKFTDDDDTYAFVGYVGMTQEETVFDKLVQLNIPPEKFINLIDPTAVIPEGFCSIGSGVLMAPLSQLGVDTTISDNCILLGNCFIGHNTTLDRYVSVATNATLGANVHVGKAVHIGSNATIREKVTIGDFSLVGMGSVVLKDVPPHAIVAGNPARVISQKE
jgi:acetyltransferase EpsM